MNKLLATIVASNFKKKEGKVMVYIVGTGWAWGLGVVMVLAFIIGVIFILNRIFGYGEKSSLITGIVLVAFSLVCCWFWFFAATHFRVNINERALVIDKINQEVVDVKESGVQQKRMAGIKIQPWPANVQYPINVTMSGGTQSATTKNGTSVYNDVIVYVDLSEMDIESAYKAVNGDWNVFLNKNLLPGLLSISRSVSQDFLTSEHTVLRDEWERQFEAEAKEYLAKESKGFSISIIPGRTVLSWDFVNSEDATAYDNANRALYQVTQNENEKAALMIEAEMVTIRNEMIAETADGTIVNLDKVSEYLKGQPRELWPYLISYLKSMENMEYLRIIGDEKPEIILPPNSDSVDFLIGSTTNENPVLPPEDVSDQDD